MPHLLSLHHFILFTLSFIFCIASNFSPLTVHSKWLPMSYAWFSWRSLPVKRKFFFSLSLRWEEGSNCGIVWVCLKSKVPFHSNRRGKWAIRVLLYLHSSKYRKHLGVCRFSLRGKAQGQHYVTVTNKPFFAHPHADTVDDIYFVSFPVPLQEWKKRKKIETEW